MRRPPTKEHAALTIVETTVSTEDSARTLARTLVEEKLAACAQISSPIQSLYHWNGRVEAAVEYTIRLKTLHATLKPLLARIAELHPYEIPQLVWYAADASSAYGQWAQQSLEP